LTSAQSVQKKVFDCAEKGGDTHHSTEEGKRKETASYGQGRSPWVYILKENAKRLTQR